MKLGKLSIGIAAIALAAAPALAQAIFVPAIAPLDGEESELSGTGEIIVGVLVATAVVGGIVALASDEEPASP
jgi:hypothetical protein